MSNGHTESASIEHDDLRADVIGNFVSIMDKSTREQVLLSFSEARALRRWLTKALTDDLRLGEQK